MFQEWFKPGACLEFPKGGSQSMVAALVRGVKKKGGRIMLKAHVEVRTPIVLLANYGGDSAAPLLPPPPPPRGCIGAGPC